MKRSRKLKEWHFFSRQLRLWRKKSHQEQPEEEEQGGDGTEDVNSLAKRKVYWPAISYWLAIQSVDGLRVSTVPPHAALLKTGMEVTAKSLPDCKRGQEENAVAPISTTIKDHNNDFLQRKVDLSFERCIETLQSQVLDEPIGPIRGSERVVRLQVVCPTFAVELQRNVIPALLKAGLEFDVFGIQNASEPERTPLGKALAASSVVVALNEIERAMRKLGYAVHHGEVFRKNPTAKFTFEHSCTVKKFLSVLCNNERIKNVIVPHFSKLESMLADPECEFTRPIRINYDLIEVSNGWCFSISKRQFEVNPVKEGETPRAYIEYEHTKVPDARYFQEILENSLTPDEVSYFCEYYLRLLNVGIKPHKEKVMCLIGEPNSGKTSLFTPITRIIPTRYIAMITKQRAFNKSLIDQNTQVIFLDEAYSKLLDPDDWKTLTQGGLTAHDRKYKSSAPTVIRCPMFITCQEQMNFGDEHNTAMDVRLRKFHFRKLNSPPISGVQKHLKEKAMDCIVWASGVARTPEDELPPPTPSSARENNGIDEEEKERIRTMNFEELSESDGESSEEVEQNVADEASSADSDDDATTQSSVEGWEKSLNEVVQLQDKQPCQSLKQRQLSLIAAEIKRAAAEHESEVESARVRHLEETREKWITLGMMRREDAHLLTCVEGPYHSSIQKSREEYFARKREEDQRMLEKKSRDYFKNEWVLAKEREMREYQKQEDAAKDEDVKRALQYMISVTSDALKLKFQQNDVRGLSELALLERRKMAVEMKWLSSQQAQLVNSLWNPLPYPRADEESDEEEMFITQSTSRQQAQPVSQKRSCSQKGTSTVRKRGRLTKSQGANKAPGKTLLDFYSQR